MNEVQFQTKEIILQRVVSNHFKRRIFIASILVAVLAVSFLSFTACAKAQEGNNVPAKHYSLLASVADFFKSFLFPSPAQKDTNQSAEIVPIKQLESKNNNNPLFQTPPLPPLPIQSSSSAVNVAVATSSPNSSESVTYPPATTAVGQVGRSNLSPSVTRNEILGLIKQSDNRNLALIRSILTAPSSTTNSDSLSIQQSINNLSQRISAIQENNIRQTDHVYNSISRSFDDITSLDGVTMTNSSFSGTTGTFTGVFTGTSGTFSESLTVSGNGNFDSGTLYIDSVNNRVGIASSSPSETFSVNGATYLSQISAPSNTTDRLYNASGDLYWNGNLIGSASVGNWTSSGSNVYRASGNVGIGTTTPNWKLSVAGIGSFDDNVRSSYFTATSTTATSSFAGGLSVAGSSGLTVLQNGNVGVGTTSPEVNFQVVESGQTTNLSFGKEAGYNPNLYMKFNTYRNAAPFGLLVESSTNQDNVINDLLRIGYNPYRLAGVPTFLTSIESDYHFGGAYGTEYNWDFKTKGEVNVRPLYLYMENTLGQEILWHLKIGKSGVGNSAFKIKDFDENDLLVVTPDLTTVYKATQMSSNLTVDGNLGVKTTGANNQAFDVNGSTDVYGRYRSSAGVTSLLSASNDISIYRTIEGGIAYPFLENGNLVLQSRANSDRDIVFVNGATPTVKAVVSRDGNLGIGTTSPWRTLSVTGSMAVTALTAGAAGDYAVCINNTTKEITNAGATGCVVSSKRFKENISELDSGLDELMQLKPSKFNYIGQTGEHIGLIAEDVNEVDKRLVEYEADGIIPRTVRYLELSALLIKSIQDLNIKIDNLSLASTSTSLSANEAGSTDSTEPSSGLFSWIVNKFMTTLGIVFEKDMIEAEKVKAKNICVDDVCVTKSQFKELLDKNGITSSATISSSSSSANSESSVSSVSSSPSSSSNDGSSSSTISESSISSSESGLSSSSESSSLSQNSSSSESSSVAKEFSSSSSENSSI